MSDTVDEPRPEQGNVNKTQHLADDIDWSQFYDMFMKIEQRLPNFDHMLIAMNDYAFQRTSRQRQTNDLSEFCGVLKKGFLDWIKSSIKNKINRLPNFVDLTNQVFDDDILMEVDKKLVSSTSPTTDTSKIINTSASTDANESTNTNTNADTIKCTGTSPNTDACKSKNTNASESITSSDNADASESKNTGTNADASGSTSKSTNACFHKSVNACSHTSASICTNKRAKTSMNTYSAKVENTKHFYRHVGRKSVLETLETLSQSTEQPTEKSTEKSTESTEKSTESTEKSTEQSTEKSTEQSTEKSTEQSTEQSIEQSTMTNIVTDYNFDIIMPCMAKDKICLRKRLPIDLNIHLGNDYERHWWRQTSDTIILNVDISDLVADSVPNIKIMVNIIGFKVKIKRSNKWILVLSNKFEKAISKSTWVINNFMHIRFAINKREKEFWRKCLITETKKIDKSIFQNHCCSNACTTPPQNILENEASKKECLNKLATYLKNEYNFDEFIEDIDQFTETNPPSTEEKPQDSAISLSLSVDSNTEKSPNSDSENSPNTKQTSMDSEVPPNLPVSCNAEVSQNQSDTPADFKSVESSSHP